MASRYVERLERQFVKGLIIEEDRLRLAAWATVVDVKPAAHMYVLIISTAAQEW